MGDKPHVQCVSYTLQKHIFSYRYRSDKVQPLRLFVIFLYQVSITTKYIQIFALFTNLFVQRNPILEMKAIVSLLLARSSQHALSFAEFNLAGCYKSNICNMGNESNNNLSETTAIIFQWHHICKGMLHIICIWYATCHNSCQYQNVYKRFDIDNCCDMPAIYPIIWWHQE